MKPEKQIDPKKLIVWSELSRLLCGSATSLQSTRISKVQSKDIENLMNLIRGWWEGIQARKKD
ncbi:MAG TPA: hypothetical protein VIK55_06570 [Paludibacter sp.]